MSKNSDKGLDEQKLPSVNSQKPGSLLPMVMGAWSEREQEKMNRFLAQWMKMLEEEIREKEETVM